jgi:hypothetical protein
MRKFEDTAAAVRRYDCAGARMSRHQGDTPIEALVAAYDTALLEVRTAFANDTADINSKENAFLVTPDGNNGWLRKMLMREGHTDCALTASERANRGWGW